MDGMNDVSMDAWLGNILGARTGLFKFLDSFDNILDIIALCSLRFFAAFNVLPAMNDQFIQGLTRTGLIVVLSFYASFGLPENIVLSMTALQWVVLMVKEALIGLMLGFLASLVFWTAECVGAMIDTETGYNSVQMTNPMSDQQSTPVSNLLLQLVSFVFYSLGGMLLFVGVIIESFKVWPIMSPLPSMSGISDAFIMQQVASLMMNVVKFAAPVLLILMLIDLGFGLITKAADKLQPSSLSQPVKGAVTMLLLALLVGVFIEQIRHYLLPLELIKRLQAFLPA